MARCSSCNAEIWWGTTARDRRMPLDGSPSEKGNVIRCGETAHVMLVRVLTREELESGAYDDVPRYLSHHATCPQGRRWQGKKRGANGAPAAERTGDRLW